MVLSTLAVSYQDTRAAALGWSLTLGEQPAVAELGVRLPGARLRLRVLGASHQVVLRPTGAGTPLTETVACLPEPLPPLPGAADVVLGDLRYTVRSEVVEVPGPAFAAEVEALLTHHGPDRDALVGRFPGDTHAVTVLWADRRASAAPSPDAPGAVARWCTWHAYPEHRQIVRTTTVVRRVEEVGEPCDA